MTTVTVQRAEELPELKVAEILTSPWPFFFYARILIQFISIETAECYYFLPLSWGKGQGRVVE